MVEIKKELKYFWNWLWNSESWLSYLIFLIIVFIVVKFIFLPGLGLIFGTSLPLAIVESSSMEHYSLGGINSNCNGYDICGNCETKSTFFNKDNYWNTCRNWYEQNTNITKEQFNSFRLSDGFRKGDLIIIYGKKQVEIGDIIVFNGGTAHPIIHRVISLDPIQTKGDHNPSQLSVETNIQQNQVIGTAFGRIPYIGWIKIFFVELLNGFK